MPGLGLGLDLGLAGGRTSGGTTQIAMDVVVNFDGSSGIITAAKMNTGTHGANWGTWTTPEGAPNHTSIEDHDVLMPFPMVVDGVEYDGLSGQGVTFDESTEPAGADVLHYGLSATISSCQLMYLARYQTVLDGGSPVSYNCDLWQIAGANFTVPQRQHTFADAKFFTAHTDGDLGASIADDEGWVLVSVFHNVSGAKAFLMVQQVIQSGPDWVLGNLLGTSTGALAAAGDVIYIRFQDYLRPASGTGTIKVKIAGLRNSVLTWPPYNPGTIPAPGTVAVTQTGIDTATLTWTNVCDTFRIERKTTGAYSTLVAEYENNGTDSYVDSTVSDGVTYTYRVTTLLGTLESSSVESNAITIDNTFTPAAGNVLWLKADTLVLSNNDPVTTWADSSGLGNDVTQSTGAAKPTYKTNILNGLPVVRGDGGDYLSHSGVVTANEQHTMMIVLKVSAANAAVPFYNGNTASDGWGFIQDDPTGFRAVLFGGAAGKTDGTPSAVNFEVWTHTWNASVSTFWVNGTEENLTDPTTAPAGAPTGNTLVMGLAGSNGWNGDIAEILIWDNVLSTANRQAAEDYLGLKYGITITH